MSQEAGPWYEVTGPTALDVRKDLFQKIKKKNDETGKIISDKELETILLKHVPDTKTDFGSWRGYATFGLDKSILDNINMDLAI